MNTVSMETLVKSIINEFNVKEAEKVNPETGASELVGAAVALALKDSLANVAGGVLISINKPFTKGDYINNMSVEGTVDQIDILCTTIHTVDNKIITIPNGTLSNSTIINYRLHHRFYFICSFSRNNLSNLRWLNCCYSTCVSVCNFFYNSWFH